MWSLESTDERYLIFVFEYDFIHKNNLELYPFSRKLTFVLTYIISSPIDRIFISIFIHLFSF